MFIANNSTFKSIMQYFFSQINSAEGVLPNDEFWRKSFYRFENIRKIKFVDQTLIECDFWKVVHPNIFFQEICSSGGKQTIHKVSAVFIVKNCHPRTAFSKKTPWTGRDGQFFQLRNIVMWQTYQLKKLTPTSLLLTTRRQLIVNLVCFKILALVFLVAEVTLHN